MNRVLLITSGAFTGTELQVEFGRLPPAFLPIGNRRLFVHQHAAFAPGMGRVILSLPEDFTPSALDLDLLRSLAIEVVHVPAGLSLGQSVVYVINVTAIAGSQLAILHGDTLLRGIDTAEPDTVSVGSPPHSYEWGHVHVSGGYLLASPPPDAASNLILSGYFSLSDTVRLVQAITRRAGSFVAGVQDYAAQRPLRAITATEWLDFGHANTYHQSRGRVTTERAFNDLQTTPRMVVKSGTKPDKIRAESRWFDTLPATLRAHTPAFLGQRDVAGNPGYALEYLYLPTLADLYVFGRLTPPGWDRIFDACNEFLAACAAFPAPAAAPPATQALFGAKTHERLEEYAATSGIDIDAPCRFDGRPMPSLRAMAAAAAQAVPPPAPGQLRLVHGDFCFSNILFDARASLVRVIDPRGVDAEGTHTSFGDVRYDLAKLYHSVVGRYDHIMAGYCRVTGNGLDLALELPSDATLDAIQDRFLARSLAGLGHVPAASHAICILLFLSMLPLHGDDPRRQRALAANAMRLFARPTAQGGLA